MSGEGPVGAPVDAPGGEPTAGVPDVTEAGSDVTPATRARIGGDASPGEPRMTGERWPSRAVVGALAAITAVGLAWRWFVFVVLVPMCPGPPGPGQDGCYNLWGDAYVGWLQGQLLSEGHWFVDPYVFVATGVERPSAGKPPLYPLFLGLLSAVGVDSPQAQRLALATVGAAVVFAVGWIGWRIASPRAGIVAAAVAAVYPPLWINDGMLMSEPLFALATAGVIGAAYRLWRTPSGGWAAVLGVAVALAALARTESLLLFGVLVPFLVWRIAGAGTRRRLALGAICVGAGAALILPWVAWNRTRFAEPVFVTSSTGAVLSAGACDDVFYGASIGFWAQCRAAGPDERALDESQRDVIARAYAYDYYRENLSRVPLVVAARIGRLWHLYAPGQTVELDWQLEGRGQLAVESGFVAYLVLVPFALGGVVALWRRRLPVSPLVSQAVVATLAAAVTFGLLRYRVGADVAMVLAGGIGADAAWRAWRRRVRPGPSPGTPDGHDRTGEPPVPGGEPEPHAGHTAPERPGAPDPAAPAAPAPPGTAGADPTPRPDQEVPSR